MVEFSPSGVSHQTSQMTFLLVFTVESSREFNERPTAALRPLIPDVERALIDVRKRSLALMWIRSHKLTLGENRAFDQMVLVGTSCSTAVPSMSPVGASWGAPSRGSIVTAIVAPSCKKDRSRTKV